VVIAFILAAAAQSAPCTNSDPTLTNAVSAHVAGADPQLGVGRVATVRVTIGPDGRVTDAGVYESSGDATADAAAIAAARASTYVPAMQDCKPVSETVYFNEIVRPDYAHLGSNCSISNSPATTLRASQPVYPDAARILHAGGVAAVRLNIGPDGGLIATELVKSTGNKALDQAALNAAENSIYAPGIVNCRPVAGHYIFKVTFDPN